MKLRLWHLILIGMLVGIGLGAALDRVDSTSEVRKFALNAATTIGDIFVRLITVVMVPLVISSLVVGMAAIGNPKKLGRIGLKAITYFMITTSIAISIGLIAVNIMKPGSWLGKDKAEQLKAQYAKEAQARQATAQEVQKTWNHWEFAKSLFPKNIVESMVKQDMLPIIVFSLLLGLAAMLIPEANARPFLNAMTSFNEVMLKMIELIMWSAPVGVLALMTKVILMSGIGILGTLAGYGLTVLIALAIHFFFTYSLTVKTFTKLSVLDFFRAMRLTHLTAFSTSSSAATLPVNMATMQQRLNISQPISSFILPLGATVNMDGTALYQGVAAVFIAQVYGIDLTVSQQLAILLTATLASIGAAPVPGAGMVMLAVIMAPLNIPLEGLALIFGIDRFLDMCRTVLNVTGDAACAAMVASSEGEDVRYISENPSAS
jgi:Na+/H+-dicarboxylate symporter